jgi:huntingtin interacting protein 1
MATLPPFFSSANQGQQLGPILDRDKFEKELTESISKALLTTEVPVKEKHVRNIILSTWREKGCTTFWKIIHLQPLDRNTVICYKSCYVIHKVLRDGYSDVSNVQWGTSR